MNDLVYNYIQSHTKKVLSSITTEQDVYAVDINVGVLRPSKSPDTKMYFRELELELGSPCKVTMSNGDTKELGVLIAIGYKTERSALASWLNSRYGDDKDTIYVDNNNRLGDRWL